MMSHVHTSVAVANESSSAVESSAVDSNVTPISYTAATLLTAAPDHGRVSVDDGAVTESPRSSVVTLHTSSSLKQQQLLRWLLVWIKILVNPVTSLIYHHQQVWQVVVTLSIINGLPGQSCDHLFIMHSIGLLCIFHDPLQFS